MTMEDVSRKDIETSYLYLVENKNKIDTYFIMLILCGEDGQGSPKDPRYDFGNRRTD